MSLNPASYLQAWEHNLAAVRHRYQSLHVESESDDQGEAYHDLPESSSSSASFLSHFSEDSLGHRLNIYPYAGDEAHARSHEASPVREFNSVDDHEISSKTQGAYEVGHRKRIVQVVVALISCFLSSGIIFGFAALKPILIKEGVYSRLCLDKALQGTVCYGQELRLNLMFAVASGAFNVSVFPVGVFLHFYGPRIGSILGSISLIFGSMLLAFAPNVPFDAYVPGYLFLAIGGSLIYISSLHLPNALPTYSTLVYSVISGAFSSSSAVFLIFRYVSTKTNGRFSTRIFFLVYLIVPVFILAMQFSVMPGIAYKTPAELVLQAEEYAQVESSDRADGVMPDPAEPHRIHRQNTIRKIQVLLRDESVNLSRTRNAVFGTGPLDPGYLPQIQPPRGLSRSSYGIEGPLSKQIRSPWLFLMTMFVVFQMVKLNYFIASLYQQYESLLSPDRASQINHVFDILLPIGGLFSMPVISVLDKITHSSLVISLVALATMIGIIGCIPALWAGYMDILLYAFYRPFFLVGISGYVAKVFGLRTYAIVYGLAVSVSGVGNFAMPGLDALTFRHFGGDPTPVNMVLTGVTFVTGVVLLWFVLSKNTDGGKDRRTSVESNVPVDTDQDEAEPDLETGPLLHRRSSHGKRRYGSTDV